MTDADRKITTLTALTSLTSDDIFPVVDDPGGTPETKKITWGNLLSTFYSTANIFTASQSTIIENSATNTTTTLLTLGHNSTGTPAASFGGAIIGQLESTTTANQDAFKLRWEWTTATHASRSSKVVFSTVASGSFVDVMTFDSNGNVGIGVTANSNYKLYTTFSPTATSGTYASGYFINAVSPSASSSGTFIGLYGSAYNQGVNSINTVEGLRFSASVVGAGGATYLRGAKLEVYTNVGADGPVTVATALELAVNKYGAGGAIAYANAISINDITVGASGNYAIISHAGQISFNQDGAAEADVTMKTDDYTALFIDTSNNSIVIMSNASGKVGFFGATAVVKQTGCAIPTDLPTCITAITALRTAFNNYGLTTSV